MSVPSLPEVQNAMELITLDEIRQVHGQISPYISRTPVIQNDFFSTRLSELVGHDVCVHFKCELFQPTGSFKLRGATNAVLQAINTCPSITGVTTNSSGNHGAAVAYIAKKVKVKAAIVVPEDVGNAKLTNITASDGEIVKIVPDSITAFRNEAKKIAENRGFSWIRPTDQEIIAGQATCGLEFIEDVPELEAILVPVGGGGLASGISLAKAHFKPSMKVYGVSPHCKKLPQLLNCLSTLENLDHAFSLENIFDGLRATPGELPLLIMRELMENQVLEISDAEAIESMRLVWSKLKMTAEINSAIAVAALFSDQFVTLCKRNGFKNIGIVITGGNVTFEQHFPLLESKR